MIKGRCTDAPASPCCVIGFSSAEARTVTLESATEPLKLPFRRPEMGKAQLRPCHHRSGAIAPSVLSPFWIIRARSESWRLLIGQSSKARRANPFPQTTWRRSSSISPSRASSTASSRHALLLNVARSRKLLRSCCRT